MHIPFLLAPAGKDYLWGGTRLKDEFAKNFSLTPLAETWECSTHSDGPSQVVSGPYRGESLQEVLVQRPDFVGAHTLQNGQIPILVKLIDAQQDLSVQVHPSDSYARTHENGQMGKTEMWYVLHAEPGAKLVYGFRQDVTKELVLKTLQDNTFPNYLQYIPVHQEDIFCIEPGTVHALGKGIVVAEVQENSNVTYRLYDYNRVDKHGRPRPLHVQKALEVADLTASPAPVQPKRERREQPGCQKELLTRCSCFEVERWVVNTSQDQSLAYQTGKDNFNILLFLQGKGTIRWKDDYLPVKKGDCLFVPADSVPLQLIGNFEFLQVSC